MTDQVIPHELEHELGTELPPEDLEMRGTFSMDHPLPEGFPLDDDSMMRRIVAEPVGFLMIQRALLQEVAHPKVAAAVNEHSRATERPLSRYLSTGGAALRLVYGTEQEAKEAAQRIYSIHDHINGTLPDGGGPWTEGEKYSAHDGPSLLWVWATLVDNMRETQEFAGGFQDDQEKRFYNDAVAFARFFGIPESLIPLTVEDFNEYYEAMITGDNLGSTPTSQAMIEKLLYPEMIPERIARLLRGVTLTTLDPRLVENLGLSLPQDEVRGAIRLDRRLRKYYPRLPEARLGVPKLLMGIIRTGDKVRQTIDWVKGSSEDQTQLAA